MIGFSDNSWDKSKKYNTNVVIAIISIIFISGIYFPTSIGGAINKNLTLLISIATAFAFIFLLVHMKKVNVYFLISFFVINFILYTYTIFNSHYLFVKSDAVFFLLLSLMFCLRLREIQASKKILALFNVVNIFILIVGFGMITMSAFIGGIFIDSYSDYFPELVPVMLEDGKPVISFATHSVAGFYMYIFFFLNYKVYKSINKKVYLLFAFCYLYFCIELQSNTSMFFLVLGLLTLLMGVKNKVSFLIKISLPVIAAILIFRDGLIAYWEELVFTFENTSSSTVNGFAGRFLEGNQSGNIEFILSNPFAAVGLTIGSEELVLFDSGIIVTTVRGTILLTIIVYGTLYFFLKKNLINRRNALLLFTIIMFFEVGFNNLYYFRTIMVLPFIVIFLNYLETEKQKRAIGFYKP